MTNFSFSVLLVLFTTGGVCYSGSSSGSSSGGSSSGGVPASNRHSVGPIWGPATSHNSYESLKGAPAPPRRSDSYTAIRNHERPNSWSSLEHGRSLRCVQSVKPGSVLFSLACVIFPVLSTKTFQISCAFIVLHCSYNFTYIFFQDVCKRSAVAHQLLNTIS